VPAVAVQAPQRRPADPEDSNPVAARRPCWRRPVARVLAPVMVRALRQPPVAVAVAVAASQPAEQASQRPVARAESSLAAARTPCWRRPAVREQAPVMVRALRQPPVVVVAASPAVRAPQRLVARAESSLAAARTPCWHLAIAGSAGQPPPAAAMRLQAAAA